MEVIKEEEDRQKPLAPPNKSLENFISNWRQSEFYPWVMKLLTDEVSKSFLKEQMALRYANGETMSNDEIGENARIEYQVNARLEAIIDVIK
jgi:hypothetical protein